MLKNLLSLLNEPEPEPLGEEDSKLALAVLLVRVGRSDDDYADVEKQRTDHILARRFGLSPEQAEALRLEAESIEGEVADNVSFTRTLKRAVPIEERVGLIEALWEIVLSDEQRDYTEDGYLRLVCRLLGVNDRDSALARRRVARKFK
ncbi:MAG: TerB family tellurite resistance protein [Rhodobacteraceae bacterium]|nr:TerB family tellurite resistance protein [Paracoccaceae bacterium]